MSAFWTTEPDGYVEPQLTKSGQASIPAKTVIQVFQETVAKHGNRPAMHVKRPVNVSLVCRFWVFRWDSHCILLKISFIIRNNYRALSQIHGKCGLGKSTGMIATALPSL